MVYVCKQSFLHNMKIIQRTANFLNPEQTPVDCCDEPVYALEKEIQFRLPNESGQINTFHCSVDSTLNNIFSLFLVNTYKGTVLHEILEKNKFSILGTGAAVKANHIKQVIICVIYVKLMEARNAADTDLTTIVWLKERGNSFLKWWIWFRINEMGIKFNRSRSFA